MKLIQSIITLVCILTLAWNSLMLPGLAKPIDSQNYYVMGLFDNFFNRAQATNKKIEGKIQEEKGKITGDTSEQILGKAKQIQGEAMETVQDVKEAVEKAKDEAVKNLQELTENMQ